jgi:hypothetical protein
MRIINPNNVDFTKPDGKWHRITWIHSNDGSEDVVEIDVSLCSIDLSNPEPDAFEKAWELMKRKMTQKIDEYSEYTRWESK